MQDLSLEDLLKIEITTASKDAESIKEVPVPVTVITSDMIEKMGAKNLKDVLITYVPGFTFSQDHNEVNVAVRGIYASSQQKVLIVALTAVVNIITKQGKDVDGLPVSLGTGNYGQGQLGFLYGKEFGKNNDMLLWANVYEADGEKIDINAEDDYSANPKAGSAIVDGFKDLPSYDAGLQYNVGPL